MKATVPLTLLILVASPGIAPAQTTSGSLDLEYKQRAPALQTVPPGHVEEDTKRAVRELDHQRTERMLRDVQPGPARRPDLDRDVTQGIQSRGLLRR